MPFSDDALMHASNSVTDALRRTIDTMQRELERSVLSQQLLDHSTSTLHLASRQHDTLSSLVDTSRTLITALEKSDWLDKLIISAALAFFVLVMLFILKQRIVDRGLRLAFWWVKWVPGVGGGSGYDSGVVGLERGLGKSASAVVTEVVKTATTLAGSVAAAITAKPSSSSSVYNDSSPSPTSTLLASIVSESPVLSNSGPAVASGESHVRPDEAATPSSPLPTPPTPAPGEDANIAHDDDDAQLSSSSLPETTIPGESVSSTITHEEL
jgi:protein transport protein SEC20